MAAAKRAKASDKQDVCKKIVTLLKKRYKGPVPKQDRSVLETMMYAVCLERSTHEQAVAALDRLRSSFNDLNEVRVSSVTELQPIFEGMCEPEWRAYRIRSLLQFVFDRHFEFDFESLRRKTMEQATKQLAKIKCLSPFVRVYTLQEGLGCHTVPLDDPMLNAAIWLGLADPGTSPEDGSDTLKPIVRKADVPQFCHLLRNLTNDPAVAKVFQDEKIRDPEAEYELDTAVERLTELCKAGDNGKLVTGKSATSKGKAKKSASAQSSAAKPTAKKTKAASSPSRKTSKTETSGTAKKKTRKPAAR